MNKLKFLFINTMMITSLFVGCTEDEKVDITGISFDGTTLTVTEGLTYDVADEIVISGSDADQANITFTSGDANIVSVDGTALTAEKVGTTTLTATETNSGLTATVNVEVIAGIIDVTGVQIYVDGSEVISATVEGNEELELTAVVTPADASNQAVTWSLELTEEGARTGADQVGADHYAEINAETGVVKGKAACDDCGLMAVATTTDGAITDKITLNVTYVAVTGIQFEQSSYFTITAGQTEQMDFTVIPKNANDQKPAVTWSISSQDNGSCVDFRTQAVAPGFSDYATVDENGLITAIKNYNNPCNDLAIIAQLEGIEQTTSAMFDVENVEAESITIDQGDETIDVGLGETITLSTTLLPANTTEAEITWYNYHPNEARTSAACDPTTVDSQTGVVTASTNCQGTTTIYAYNAASDKIDSIVINAVCNELCE